MIYSWPFVFTTSASSDTTNQIDLRLVDSADVEPVITEGQPHYAILYYKELEHLRILVSLGHPGTNPS